MEVSATSQKQRRLKSLAKGVKAAAMVIDGKFREWFGEMRFVKTGKCKGKPSPLSPYRTALITLTYRADNMWQPGHISELVMHYRKWFKRNGGGVKFHCVWVMELTQIGRPHYHLIVWMPRGVVPPLPDKQGWWPHGSTNAEFAHSPVGYITKYASKNETKSGHHLPKRARLWGYSGLSMAERGPVAFAMAPRWLKGLVRPDSHPAKRSIEIKERAPYGETRIAKVSAWVLLAAGLTQGYAFFSPYQYEGPVFEGEKVSGIRLSHRGAVEMLTPEGDSFHIPHRG